MLEDLASIVAIIKRSPYYIAGVCLLLGLLTLIYFNYRLGPKMTALTLVGLAVCLFDGVVKLGTCPGEPEQKILRVVIEWPKDMFLVAVGIFTISAPRFFGEDWASMIGAYVFLLALLFLISWFMGLLEFYKFAVSLTTRFLLGFNVIASLGSLSLSAIMVWNT